MSHRNEKIAELVKRLEPAYTITCSRCKEDDTILNATSPWNAACQLYDKGWRMKDVVLCSECVRDG